MLVYMNQLINLLLIIAPIFIGFYIPVPKAIIKKADIGLTYFVYVIMFYIGFELGHMGEIFAQLRHIFVQTIVLVAVSVFSGVIGTLLFDRYRKINISIPKNHLNDESGVTINSFMGSGIQLLCLLAGLILSYVLPKNYALPDSTMTGLLMVLVFMVGISLQGVGLSLKQVFLNKHSLLLSVVFVGAIWLGGIIYALLMPSVSLSQALAMVSGFGWYSLSSIVITDTYGAMWGSVALFNDLFREILALIFIPILMKKYPNTAISIGGATSLDFTLPTIQQSGGSGIVPYTICFAFIINLLSPIAMMLFASLG